MATFKNLPTFIGFGYVENNHIVPVLAYEQLKRFAGPGYFFMNPFVEETLPPINLHPRPLRLAVTQQSAVNNYLVQLQIETTFTFDPRQANPEHQQSMVFTDARGIHSFVKQNLTPCLLDYMGQTPAHMITQSELRREIYYQTIYLKLFGVVVNIHSLYIKNLSCLMA